MINVIFFMFGLVLGASMYILLSKVFARVDGKFIIDDSDPETTQWTLKMDKDPTEIPKQKKVILNVQCINKEGS